MNRKWIELVLVTFLLLQSASVFGQPRGWKKEVKKFRKELNADYRDAEHSPLAEADRLAFRKHNFFPIDPDYRVKATMVRPETPAELVMPTVSGKQKTFLEYSWLVFDLGDHHDTLTAYRSKHPKTGEYGDYLFIPFRDFSSGSTSYGGGRYIDMDIPSDDATYLWLDFNFAYNPYCAYATGWNCPIPPDNNYVNCEVNAGLAAWEEDHH